MHVLIVHSLHFPSIMIEGFVETILQLFQAMSYNYVGSKLLL